MDFASMSLEDLASEMMGYGRGLTKAKPIPLKATPVVKSGLNKTAALLVAALRDAQLAQPDTVPDGWVSVKWLEGELGITRKYVYKRLRVIPHEKRSFNLKTKQGVRAVPHYRIK